MIAMSASVVLIRAAAHCGWFMATIEKPFDLDMLVQHVGQCLA